jgi:hypothetical protein
LLQWEERPKDCWTACSENYRFYIWYAKNTFKSNPYVLSIYKKEEDPVVGHISQSQFPTLAVAINFSDMMAKAYEECGDFNVDEN